ncbi:MAG: hypothetical protein K6T66_06525 [Peptococcaceae bacterium]|nr:hypothetical protein [Peptococcaceae bacterium]
MSNVSDIRPKPVKIMLDKERHLLYDLNAFACLEEEYGNIDGALDALAKGKVNALRAILWAGLVHEDESLTPKDVGKLLTLADLQRVAEAVNEALSHAMPQPEKNAESPPQ